MVKTCKTCKVVLKGGQNSHICNEKTYSRENRELINVNCRKETKNKVPAYLLAETLPENIKGQYDSYFHEL